MDTIDKICSRVAFWREVDPAMTYDNLLEQLVSECERVNDKDELDILYNWGAHDLRKAMDRRYPKKSI